MIEFNIDILESLLSQHIPFRRQPLTCCRCNRQCHRIIEYEDVLICTFCADEWISNPMPGESPDHPPSIHDGWTSSEDSDEDEITSDPTADHLTLIRIVVTGNVISSLPQSFAPSA